MEAKGEKQMRHIVLLLITILSFWQVGWADDYRQWYLPEGATMRLGKGSVIDIEFSPDGKQFAVASSIGIWLYDAHTYQESRLLKGDVKIRASRAIHNIVFSPNGKTLVSEDSTTRYSPTDSRILFWDIDTGTTKIKITENPEASSFRINLMEFSPDEKTLVCRYYHGYDKGSSIRLWDIQKNEHLGTFTGKKVSPIFAFSPDGNTFATVDKKGTSIIFWDTASIRKTKILFKDIEFKRKTKTLETGHTKRVNWLAFLSDTILITGHLPETVRFWNLKTLEYTEVHLTKPIYDKYRVSSSTTKMYARATEDGIIQLWDLQTGKSVVIQPINTICPTSLAFSPDSLQLACVLSNGIIQFYDTKTGKTKATISGYKTGIHWSTYGYRNEFLAFSPDSTMIVGCGQLWDLNTGKSQVLPTGKFGNIFPAALSPDGKIIASRYNEDILLSYIHNSVPKTILKGHFNRVECIAFSPDGKIIASGSSHQSSGGNRKPVTIRLWNALTAKHIRTITGHSDKVTSVAFSPDGETLASGSVDQTIRFWDIHTGEQKFGLISQKGVITSIAFSPDGKIIAAANGRPKNEYNKYPDTTIQLWEAKTGKEITAFPGHSKDVFSITFSPDGKTIASGSEDKTVRLWDIHTAQSIATFEGHLHPVYAVAFSPDGKTLASSSGNGTILFWNILEKW